MTIMVKNTNLNELYISSKEFEALNKCGSEIRYSYTLKRIADTETMWSIVDEEGLFAIQDYNNAHILPIWSSKEYAQAFCQKEWNNFKYSAFTLDYFENYMIDYICQNDLLINVFPTVSDPFGKIVGLNTFAEDLGKALEDY